MGGEGDGEGAGLGGLVGGGVEIKGSVQRAGESGIRVGGHGWGWASGKA